MANSHPLKTLKKDVPSSEPSSSTQGGKTRRRRTQRAKKKALQLSSSSSNNPADPAISAEAPLPPTPPTTKSKFKPKSKPLISKPIITKPSLTFGLRVSDLILHDTLALCSPARVTQDGDRHGNTNHEEKEKENLLPQTASSRMAAHGKTVLTLSNLPQLNLHTLVPSVKLPKHLTKKSSARIYKSKYNSSNTFAFSKLPAELRIMIEELIFTASSGNKPRFLWAMEGNRALYAEAKEVWLKTNEFGFTYQESGLNRIREGMPAEERRIVKHASLNVSNSIQACTLFHPTLLLFPSLTSLTLQTYTPPSFSLAIHHIIPSLSHLKLLTVQIHSTSKQRLALHAAAPFSQSDFLLADFFRSFVKTREMLDRMLSRQGRCVSVERKAQVWTWEAEKGEVFRPRSKKVHIRFDEEEGGIALEADAEQDGGQSS
ncbi:hypothetical protein VTL71DRAFT_7228 [Oculimacula yallundae]|uniref:Uncharacterized protein n=1 Tax=Oculimacula yallundae TaxID=86028 RepID=A0ABR4BW48_9HELO